MSGRVVDTKTGAGLAVAGVYFYAKSGATYSSDFRYAPVGSDGVGGYFVSLPPGTYRVKFALLYYTTTWWRNSTTAEGATDLVVASAGLSIGGIDGALTPAAP